MTLWAILLGSLAGSMHCGAMCGGFAMACGAQKRGPTPHISYHLGRLTGYTVLGATAGFLAGQIDGLAEQLLGVQRFAGLFLGVILIGMALHSFGVLRLPRRQKTVSIEDPRHPTVSTRLRRALRKGTTAATFSVGLMAALLPCGWLWGFVALAGATGSTLSGAATMAAFWVGTVPILIAIGGLAGVLSDRLRRWAGPVVATGLLLAGLFALASFWLPQLDGPPALGADTQCHTP